MKENKIYFVDVTNRDGVQTSRLGLAKLQKTIINLMLDDMGITQSEFGFPATTHEINYLNGNLELVERGVISRTKLSGWMRGIASDVELSFKNVPKLKNLNLSQSTSEQMINGKYLGKKTPQDIINMTCEAVECAISHGAEDVGVNAEDASRSNIEFLIKYANEAKKCGARRFRYCDTLGYEDPQTTYERIYQIAKETQMPIELHFHNDLGMAVACSVMGARAAIDAGVDAYINTAINGMGERAGNADLVSCLFEELGRGEPEIIETGRMITTGEYGGIKGFRNVYDNLELEFKDEHEARNILELVRYANVHTQKPLTSSELRFIYYYPDIAAKIMTVSPYYEPQGAIKERVDAHLLTKPHRII